MTPSIFELPITGVIVAELPTGASGERIIHNKAIEYNVSNRAIMWTLEPGNWQLIGRLSEVTEEQAKGIVRIGSYMNTYWNYVTNDTHKSNQLKTALESLHSAIKAAGLFTENPYPNINDPKFYDEPYDGTGFYQEIYSSALKDWKDKEQRTICPERTVVLSKIRR